MQHQRYTGAYQDQSVLSAWQEQLAGAAQNPKLMQQLLRRERELLPRFAGHYRRLRALPRRMRRAMQRRWKRSLAALAMLLALGVAPAHGATITVNASSPGINADGQCSLIEAIVNANDDAQTHTDCPAGSGADTIVLPPVSTQTLTSINNSAYESTTGLPVITSEITIEGNGSAIQRDSGADEFRIFAVGNSGDLTLQQTTVSGGLLGGFTSRGGGGVLNYGGTLTLTDSTISDNSAYYGGGVLNSGTLTLTDSTISGNSADSNGGGVYNAGIYAFTELTNSTISGNSAQFANGGGVSNNQGTLIVTNSTISGNSVYGSGGGVYNPGTVTVTDSTISGNYAYYGGGVDNSYGTLTVTNSTIRLW